MLKIKLQSRIVAEVRLDYFLIHPNIYKTENLENRGFGIIPVLAVLAVLADFGISGVWPDSGIPGEGPSSGQIPGSGRICQIWGFPGSQNPGFPGSRIGVFRGPRSGEKAHFPRRWFQLYRAVGTRILDVFFQI